MTRRALTFVAAFSVGISAGVTWILLVGPALRQPEITTTLESSPPPRSDERLEAPGAEPTKDAIQMEAASTTSSSVEPTATAIQKVAEEDPRIVLFGLATEAEGHAPSADRDLYVEVTNDRGKRVLANIESGRYSIAGLEPGVWKLSFRTPGYRDIDRPVTLSRSETLHREDLILEHAWNIAIELRTPEGKDLFATDGEAPPSSCFRLLCAIATKDSPGERLPSTDLTHYVDYGIGRFMGRFGMPDREFANLPKESIGYLMVLQPPPVHVSLVLREIVIESKIVDSPIRTLTFTVSPETLRSLNADLVMRIVDGPTSQPIEGVTVELSTGQSMLFSPKSGADGVVRFDQQAPGKYSIRIHAPGHAMETRQVELEPGRVTDLGTIALSSPNAIAGRIVDSEGHPVDAQPSLHPYYDNDPTQELAQSLNFGFHVDGDGRFSLSHCSPGRYLLVFGAELRNPPAQNEPEWTVAPVLIDTRSGPRQDLEIVLARGAELTLKPTSKEVVGMSFRIVTSDGLPYRRGGFYDTSASTLRIAPGAYDLVLSRDTTDIRHVPIRLSASGTSLDIAP